MQPWEQITEPGTIDDLVADATTAGHRVTLRVVRDWIAEGLLDSPQRRTKHRGSDKALHTVNQRKLFLLLLDKRQAMPKIPSLAQIPLGLWLYYGDAYVPTRQAVKALGTWLRDGARNQTVSRDGALRMLAQLDHPLASDTDRRRLERVMTEIAYSSRFGPREKDELTRAARAVFEPKSVFRVSGMVRAVGHPAAPLTVERVVAHTEALCAAIAHVRNGCLDAARMERVRQVHRNTMPDYLAQRPALAAAAPPALAQAFAEPTLDYQLNNCGQQLLTILGYDIVRA
ncbi:hypothetical protein [Streptomyces sp. NBC_01262]|uniref:hypothetical protein n=1 Tax=Streptomyces sp. NBC_01262 TaxID=2903803 RepID=UPI002E32666F|nr:hypothetical protein [Streptomyces sp. NBC_01262]